MKNKHSLSGKFRHYILMSFAALVVLGAMVYSFYSSDQMINKYSPLVDAAMEVKLEATTAHLWFEEMISGDRNEDFNEIITHIDLAIWYAQAMLKGGQNQEGTFLPLKDLTLIKEVSTTIEKLNEFKKKTSQRYEFRDSSGVGTEIDQQYDKLFKNFILQIDNVETLLQQKIKRNFNSYKITQLFLVIAVVVISVLGLLSQFRHDREQKKNIFLTNEAFNRFKIVMDSLDALVYVADMDTHEILFLNKYGEKQFGHITGKTCWQNLQKGQTGPCDFCTNKYLLNTDGRPIDAYEWEFQNTITDNWFHVIDRAIIWADGRVVRLEIATDISTRKNEELIKEALIEKLKNSLQEIDTLRGILPICSYCKNIRNDEGYYEQIEGYIHKRSGVDFSHTICPKCMKEHYPNEFKKISLG